MDVHFIYITSNHYDNEILMSVFLVTIEYFVRIILYGFSFFLVYFGVIAAIIIEREVALCWESLRCNWS